MEVKMGMYKYIRKIWKKPKDELGSIWQARILEWKKQEATTRIKRPTRLDRARSLGYKAMQGIILIRQRVNRGGRQREKIRKGRRSKHFGRRKDVDKSYQTVSEMRAVKKYPNCEVLNSYYVGEDGMHYWYEVILLDSAHPRIVSHKDTQWINSDKHKGRVHRGLTSSAKKSRGLMNKGKGSEKLRPSRTANIKRRRL
jgi:large subunit ribosomal protein L15e